MSANCPTAWRIRPRPLRRRRPFASYDDHRMVMAAAVLGLAVPGIEVENAATVAKTFPEFTRLWAAMLERACPDSAARATGPGRGRRPGAARAGLPARAPGAGPRTRTRWRASSPRSTGAGTACLSATAGHRDAGPRAGPPGRGRRRPGGAGRGRLRRARHPRPGGPGGAEDHRAAPLGRRHRPGGAGHRGQRRPAGHRLARSPTRRPGPGSSTASWSPPTTPGWSRCSA